jgi:hypothetical protein
MSDTKTMSNDKQILRSRAFRALAQDDMRAGFVKRERGETIG